LYCRFLIGATAIESGLGHSFNARDMDMFDSIALRAAEGQVSLFNDQSSALVGRSAQVLADGDYEDFLQLGIGAWEWIHRAEERWRDHVTAGRLGFDAEVHDALIRLYEAWLRPCELAERAIESWADASRKPANWERFKECCNLARDTVERLTWLQQARLTRTNSTDIAGW
jgi:hypothetical protein